MDALKKLVMMAACIALTGCDADGSYDVTIAREPGKVAAPLLMASVAEASALLPGMKVVKTRPSDRELKFTFPGSGKYDPATILFRFEPAAGGKQTAVHAEVDVPAVVATINGQKKVLSEGRVTAEIRRILSGMAKGDSDSKATERLSMVLVGLTISTDDALRERAISMAKNPALAVRDLLDSEGGGDQVAAIADSNDPTEFDTPRDGSEEFSPDRTDDAEGPSSEDY